MRKIKICTKIEFITTKWIDYLLIENEKELKWSLHEIRSYYLFFILFYLLSLNSAFFQLKKVIWYKFWFKMVYCEKIFDDQINFLKNILFQSMCEIACITH